MQFILGKDEYMLDNLMGLQYSFKAFLKKTCWIFKNRYNSIYNNDRMCDSIIVHPIHNNEFENWFPLNLKHTKHFLALFFKEP